MKYWNVDFEVGSNGGWGGYTVRLRSRLGYAEAPFVPPVSTQDLGNRFLSEIERQISRSGDAARFEGQPARDVRLPAEFSSSQSDVIGTFGDSLFQALIDGPVRDILERILGFVLARNEGLRLRLYFDPQNAAVRRLASLPWELMRYPATRGYFARRRETPIVRHFPLPYAPPEPLRGELRVLVVQAEPKGWAPLDLAEEGRRIQTALRVHLRGQVDSLLRPTLDLLRARLRDGAYHVLHFMGHGSFDLESGEGALLFENPDGSAQQVSSHDLGTILSSLPDLRLVVLNACDTGTFARRDGQDVYSGVATALVLAGVPAVLAMQFPITDAAAKAFSGKLYEGLAAYDPLEVAVVEARIAMAGEANSSFEWAIPALFARDFGDSLVSSEAVSLMDEPVEDQISDAKSGQNMSGRYGSTRKDELERRVLRCLQQLITAGFVSDILHGGYVEDRDGNMRKVDIAFILHTSLIDLRITVECQSKSRALNLNDVDQLILFKSSLPSRNLFWLVSEGEVSSSVMIALRRAGISHYSIDDLEKTVADVTELSKVYSSFTSPSEGMLDLASLRQCRRLFSGMHAGISALYSGLLWDAEKSILEGLVQSWPEFPKPLKFGD